MDTEKYNTEFSIRLKPHGLSKPIITYSLDQKFWKTIELDTVISLSFTENFTEGPHEFYLLFQNKTNETPDMAVEILDVSVENITLDRFKWSSTYTPEYPEPWASQQTTILPLEHKSATYLGWNGMWKFQFEIPIFTWIHKLEGLGWIYAIDNNGHLYLKN